MSLRSCLFALCLALPLLGRAEEPATFTVGGLTFTRPAEWKWIPVSSPMRKAQLQVPGAAAEQFADITFFHFGESNGGGVDANAQRWLKQFTSKPGAEKVEPQDLGGRKVTLVTTEGTFASGMPGGPTKPLENHALLGAMLEDPQGIVFVKMTGPSETVKAARGKFLDFLKTATAAKN